MLFTRLHAARPRLPSLCAVCRGWGMQRVCATCVDRFATWSARCERCALRVPDGTRLCGACLTDPPPFAHTLGAVDYDHPWDGLITHFKFHGALDLAPALTQRLLDAFERGDYPAPSLLLPVPLSSARLRERGYNQAWELARRLARALRCDTDAHLLLRVKDTPHQLALPPEQRAGNVRAAFAVEPRRLAGVRGRRVTIVDDVMTTAATASELARVLLQAGAAEVSVWVVARTPRHDGR
ncbi:MAG: phosphoribosyltransferase family protein [Burkholderiales bacterium]